MMEGRKLKRNRVWSANKGEVVCNEYKFSIFNSNSYCSKKEINEKKDGEDKSLF